KGSHTNYMIDLSNGATGRIAGNTFVVGPNKDNYSTMITVAPEGRERNSTGLVVENNTASVAPDFEWKTTFVGNWTNDTVLVRNNKLGERNTPTTYRRRSPVLILPFHGVDRHTLVLDTVDVIAGERFERVDLAP